MITKKSMVVPPQTAKIFEWLSKGQFLNSHSANLEQEALYRATEMHFEELRNYFSHIGYQLERGKNYFYLSRLESKTSLEDKLSKLARYISVVDFLIHYDSGFGVGTRFNIEEIVQNCKADVLLRRKLKRLELRGENVQDRVKRLVDMMLKEHFFELESELEKSYRVLQAFHYLEDLIQSIQIEAT